MSKRSSDQNFRKESYRALGIMDELMGTDPTTRLYKGIGQKQSYLDARRLWAEGWALALSGSIPNYSQKQRTTLMLAYETARSGGVSNPTTDEGTKVEKNKRTDWSYKLKDGIVTEETLDRFIEQMLSGAPKPPIKDGDLSWSLYSSLVMTMCPALSGQPVRPNPNPRITEKVQALVGKWTFDGKTFSPVVPS